MKYEVEILESAQKELDQLEKIYRKPVLNDIEIIENLGIEHIKVKPLRYSLFEIKSGKVRSIFTYETTKKDTKEEYKIVLIGVVFLKTTQKTPNHLIELAKKRLLK